MAPFEFQVIDNIGGRGRNRTYNQSIKSRMLCQLSYASKLLGSAFQHSTHFFENNTDFALFERWSG